MAKAQQTQADMRNNVNPTDQFGRLWFMQVERLTGDPTGGVIPAGWTDPLKTPMKYVKVERDPQGRPIQQKVRVDFEKWIDEHSADDRAWLGYLTEIALDKYTKVSADQFAELENDPFITKLAGPRPWPAIEVLEQAKEGHRRFLGLEPLTREDRLALNRPTREDLLSQKPKEPVQAPPKEETYPEFVSRVCSTGLAKNTKEAAQLWNQQKAAQPVGV